MEKYSSQKVLQTYKLYFDVDLLSLNFTWDVCSQITHERRYQSEVV